MMQLVKVYIQTCLCPPVKNFVFLFVIWLDDAFSPSSLSHYDVSIKRCNFFSLLKLGSWETGRMLDQNSEIVY